MKDIDWVGRWYSVARERGRSDRVDFGRVREDGSLEWFDFPHELGDGVYAMQSTHQKLGRQPPPTPRGRETAPPQGWRKVAILLKALRPTPLPPMRWLNPSPGAAATPKEICWHVFTAAETKRILARAKSEGVSVNAWIMARLNDTALPALLAAPATGRWLFPVNMRGPLADSPRGNQSSGIPVVARPGLTAPEIHASIRESLKGGAHWATWWMLHAGKVVGLKGMAYLSKRSEQKSFWLGSFTNLGEWTSREAPAGEAWLAAPPGSPNYPIGVGIVIWTGRMSIVFKVHPAVCADRALPPRIFEEFLGRLLRDA